MWRRCYSIVGRGDLGVNRDIILAKTSVLPRGGSRAIRQRRKQDETDSVRFRSCRANKWDSQRDTRRFVPVGAQCRASVSVYVSANAISSLLTAPTRTDSTAPSKRRDQSDAGSDGHRTRSVRAGGAGKPTAQGMRCVERWKI